MPSRRRFVHSSVASLAFAKSICLAEEADGPFREVETKLVRLAKPLDPPQPGDWIAVHPEPREPTFDQYVAMRPIRKSSQFAKIYVVELGDTSEAEQAVFSDVIEYLSIFFSAAVQRHAPWGIDKIPPSARRINKNTNDLQIFTGFVLDKLLQPQLPPDALAFIALSTVDLWGKNAKGEDFNFVFGQANTRTRVGVWSTARFGNPEDGEKDRLAFLRRTIAVASHETMHMLSMTHCKTHYCVLNGSNNLTQTDSKPLIPCPGCARKLSWNLNQSPAVRYEKLAAFCDQRGLVGDKVDFDKAVAILKS